MPSPPRATVIDRPRVERAGMIVTFSRAYGAAAQAVSRIVAERLGYRLVDEQLPVVAAWRLGTSADVVQTVSERPRGFGERVLANLGGGIPEAAQPPAADDFPADARRAIEEAVRDEAAGGNAVIVGRMAGAILGPRADVLRVFIHAPLAWRVARVAESLGVDAAAARAEIARIDEARRTYAREGYRVTWGDPRNYDLFLDSSRFGVDGSAEIVIGAVRAASR
jgi:cytidylate kinase